MSENSNTGGCVWRSLAEFLCSLSPEQYILLPTLLASNIYCTTNSDEQSLISLFLAVLSQEIDAISTQGDICGKNHSARNNGANNGDKNGDKNARVENVDIVERTSNTRGGNSSSSNADILTFE